MNFLHGQLKNLLYTLVLQAEDKLKLSNILYIPQDLYFLCKDLLY